MIDEDPEEPGAELLGLFVGSGRGRGMRGRGPPARPPRRGRDCRAGGGRSDLAGPSAGLPVRRTLLCCLGGLGGLGRGRR